MRLIATLVMLCALAGCRRELVWVPFVAAQRSNPGTVEEATRAAVQVMTEGGASPEAQPGAVYTAWEKIASSPDGQRGAESVADKIVRRMSGVPETAETPEPSCFEVTELEGVRSICKESVEHCEMARGEAMWSSPGPCHPK